MTGVVFDFGNVLYEVDYGAMARRLAGDRADAWLAGVARTGVHDAYESGRAGLEDVLRALAEAGFAVSRERFLDAYLGIFRPVPGMADLLARLAERRPLGLLSNTSPEHARLFIEQTPEFRLLRARVYSFEAGVMKPAPEIYRAAVAAMGVPGSELAYTDDVAAFARAAGAAGMTGIPFRSAPELARDLAALGFDELEGFGA